MLNGQINILGEDGIKKEVLVNKSVTDRNEIKQGMFIKCVDNNAWFNIGKFNLTKNKNYRVRAVSYRGELTIVTILDDYDNQISLSSERFVW